MKLKWKNPFAVLLFLIYAILWLGIAIFVMLGIAFVLAYHLWLAEATYNKKEVEDRWNKFIDDAFKFEEK